MTWMPSLMQSHFQLASHWSTIPSQRHPDSKSQRLGRKDKTIRTMERQMNRLISLKKKSPDRCMNIDYFEHQFTDRTTCCPKSENRSESTGIWTCWRECAQRIDLACLMRTESYLHEYISNLSGCITSWRLLTICRNTLTNTNGEINLRFVITPLLITDKYMHSGWQSHQTLSMPHFSLSFDTRREATETVCLSAPLQALPLSQHLLHSGFYSCSSYGSMLSLFMCCLLIEEHQR